MEVPHVVMHVKLFRLLAFIVSVFLCLRLAIMGKRCRTSYRASIFFILGAILVLLAASIAQQFGVVAMDDGICYAAFIVGSLSALLGLIFVGKKRDLNCLVAGLGGYILTSYLLSYGQYGLVGAQAKRSALLLLGTFSSVFVAKVYGEILNPLATTICGWIGAASIVDLHLGVGIAKGLYEQLAMYPYGYLGCFDYDEYIFWYVFHGFAVLAVLVGRYACFNLIKREKLQDTFGDAQV